MGQGKIKGKGMRRKVGRKIGIELEGERNGGRKRVTVKRRGNVGMTRNNCLEMQMGQY